MNNLHGGAISTIFDLCTSFAVGCISRESPEGEPFWTNAGVSRTLGCTYLKPVPDGMKVRIVCDVVGVGKRLATIRAWIQKWEDGEKIEDDETEGEALAMGEHGTSKRAAP